VTNPLQNPFSSLPPFWQGVAASVLATVLIAIAVRLFTTFSIRARDTRSQRQERIKAIVNNLASSDSVIRVEAYLRSLFALFRYFFYACIFWALYGVVSIFGSINSTWYTITGYACALLILVSLVFFYFGLRMLTRLEATAHKSPTDIDGAAIEILGGTYGTRSKKVDVTELLRANVRNGRLLISVSNELAGTDPEPGVGKYLKVEYRYGGLSHSRTIPEGQTLSLP
jgi:hypothetical protein